MASITIKGVTYNTSAMNLNLNWGKYNGNKWVTGNASSDGSGGSATALGNLGTRFCVKAWSGNTYPVRIDWDTSGSNIGWYPSSALPTAYVKVYFSDIGETIQYTWGQGGNFPSATKAGYAHTGWVINGTTYLPNQTVTNAWVSSHAYDSTLTATATWETTSPPITSATDVTLPTSGVAYSTVTWESESADYEYTLSCDFGQSHSTGTPITGVTGTVTGSVMFTSDFIDEITTSKTATAYIKLATTGLGYTEKAITLTVPDGLNPTVHDITFAKVADTANPFTGKICTLLDKVNVSWAITLSHYSPIQTRAVAVNGETLTPTANNATSDNVVTEYGSGKSATVTVTDARGNSGTLTSTGLNVYRYFYPFITVKSQAKKLLFNGNVAYVGGSNSITLTYSAYIGDTSTPIGSENRVVPSSILGSVVGGTYDGMYNIDADFDLPSDIADALDAYTLRFEVKLQDSVSYSEASSYSAVPMLTFKAKAQEAHWHKPVIFEKEAYVTDENSNTVQVQPIMKTTASASFNSYGCYNTGIDATTYTVTAVKDDGSKGIAITPFAYTNNDNTTTWWIRAIKYTNSSLYTSTASVTIYYIKQA